MNVHGWMAGKGWYSNFRISRGAKFFYKEFIIAFITNSQRCS